MNRYKLFLANISPMHALFPEIKESHLEISRVKYGRSFCLIGVSLEKLEEKKNYFVALIILRISY